LIVLVVLVGGIQILTMPKFLYPGDPFASRAEAIGLINTGKLGIDYTQRKLLDGLVENRGQYLFENGRQQKLYSKFGFAQTLFYLPPLVVEQALTDNPLSLLHQTRSFVCILNVYQMLFALMAAVYLYLCAGFYTDRRWLQVLFVICSIYATYLWHYLRAPSHEVLQVVFIVGFYYHSVAFLRSATSDASSWRHLLVATLYVGGLVFCKLSYVFLLLPLWALIYLSRNDVAEPPSLAVRPAMTRIQRLVGPWKSHGKQLSAYLGAPTLAIAVLVLTVNYVRFGSPFDTGYRQWCDDEGRPLAYLSANTFLESFPFLVYRVGNANVFVHYPPLLFAVFGWRGFWRRYPRDGTYILLVCIPSFVALGCFSAWRGEWCYGPRYYLPFLIIASFPMLELVRKAIEAVKTWGAPVLAIMLIASLYSLRLQVNVIATHYFVYHYTSAYFSQAQLTTVSNYFDHCAHRGVVHGDILKHRYNHRTFFPIREIEKRLPPDEVQGRQRMRVFVDNQAKLNFYWLGDL
jgi:hypothetical protein